MTYRFSADEEPLRTESANTGDGMVLAKYSALLRPESTVDDPAASHALQMHKDEHQSVSKQQSRIAHATLALSIGGFAVITLIILAITQTPNLATQIALGGGGSAVAGIVYFLRKTVISANRELLDHNKSIREAAASIEKENQKIALLRLALTTNPKQCLATLKQLEK